MSSRKVYDDWEKLVNAVRQREKDYMLARCDSITSSSSLLSSSSSSSSSSSHLSDSNGLYSIQFSEIKKATGNFRPLHFRPGSVSGETSFPLLFRGWFHEDTLTAAKIGTGICLHVELKLCSMQEQKEWLILSHSHHPNVLKVIGYCSLENQLILVYEFIQRRSLDLLFEFNRYTGYNNHIICKWATRIKAALGAARALSFFHDREIPVLHPDFKSGSILLDGEFNAKLSDLNIPGAAEVSTLTRASLGYVAPEYLITCHLTTKCNVYSFGIVLLELLAGCRVIEQNKPANEQNLVDWAKPFLPYKRKFLRIMDYRLEGQYPGKEAYAVGKLAFKCLNPKPEQRPPMSEVLLALEHL